MTVTKGEAWVSLKRVPSVSGMPRMRVVCGDRLEIDGVLFPYLIAEGSLSVDASGPYPVLRLGLIADSVDIVSEPDPE